MTARKRRALGSSRPPAKRRYRKLFVVGTEGSRTEMEYLAFLNSTTVTVHVRCLKGKRNAPRDVLVRMKSELREQALRKTDEAWLLVDRDSWEPQDLDALHAVSYTHLTLPTNREV